MYLVKGGAPEGVGWRERRRRRREAGSTGGVWVRKVRLIPPDQVLGDSYNKAAADRALAVNVARFEEIRAAVCGTASSPVVNAPLDAPAGGGQAGSSGRKRRGKRGGRAHGGSQSTNNAAGGAPVSPAGGVAPVGVVSASPAPGGGLPGTRPAGSRSGASVSVLPGVPVGGLPGVPSAASAAGGAEAGSSASPDGGAGSVSSVSPDGGGAGGSNVVAPVRRGLRR